MFISAPERKKEELEEKGIQVIASNLDTAVADVPAVSGAMTMPVINKEYQYVVDLGGNDVGTLVLGRIKPLLDHAEADFFYGSQCLPPEYLYT